ncbi:MAG: pyridoxamine 5'-phosphate oxidase [Pseudomonadota bacterium]
MSDPLIPATPSADTYKSDGARPLIDETAEPFALFRAWMAEARETELNDSNAMSLATVDADGMPDVRMVLLKDISVAGFTFFTHLTSAKGQQLTKASAKAALGFHWKSLRRQIRIRGIVSRVPDEQADAYYATRARASRIGAWASDQSQALSGRAELEARLANYEETYEGQEDIPRPPNWIGFCVSPISMEFWQDQPFRLHDRVVFTRDGEGWETTRLYP